MIRPFTWTNLKKISASQAAFAEALQELIPATGSSERLGIDIRKMLMKHLGEKSFYYLDSVSTESYLTFLSGMGETSIIATISMEPLKGRIVAQIDTNLAFLLVERLLSGNIPHTGEMPSEIRPLTDTEAGILQYLIMQVLANIWKACGVDANLHFRFDRFFFQPKDIATLAPNGEMMSILTFKVGIGELAGFVKIAFGSEFARKASDIAAHGKRGAQSAGALSRIARYDYIRTSLWAEAGRASISNRELATLEEGDVVIFDECGLRLKGGKPTGEVELRVGAGEAGFLRASVEADDNSLKCTVTGG